MIFRKDDISDDALRVAFSFESGTFDLQTLCPKGWFEAEEGRSTAVRLDRRWERMFGSLRSLGILLASASSGPLSLTDAWLKPAFLRIPESDILIEVETGCEVRCSAINSALAIVEEVGDQQLASLQFLDSTGQGVLKILLTSGSNLTAFEQLVVAHAWSPVQDHERHAVSSHHPILSRPPAAAAVRSLWSGLSRTMPGNYFPGLDGVSRHAALSVAGPDLAWQVSATAVKKALEQVTLRNASLGGAVRNAAVVLPAAFRPFQSQSCHCGNTWFSDVGQFTLFSPDSAWQAWAIRYLTATDEVICLEFYDAEDRFCGGLGLRPDATGDDHRAWMHALRIPRELA